MWAAPPRQERAPAAPGGRIRSPPPHIVKSVVPGTPNAQLCSARKMSGSGRPTCARGLMIWGRGSDPLARGARYVREPGLEFPHHEGERRARGSAPVPTQRLMRALLDASSAQHMARDRIWRGIESRIKNKKTELLNYLSTGVARGRLVRQLHNYLIELKRRSRYLQRTGFQLYWEAVSAVRVHRELVGRRRR